MDRRHTGLAAAVLAAVALIGCESSVSLNTQQSAPPPATGGGNPGGDDGGDNGGDDGNNPPPALADVRASAWVRNATDIDGYVVDVIDPQTAVDVTLLDTGGNELGTLAVRLLSSDANPATDGALQATLSVNDAPQLTLISNGLTRPDGYTAVLQLIDSSDERVTVEADFRYQSCYEGPATPADAPDCAAPLSLGSPAYALPSCGPLRLAGESVGISTQLTGVRYVRPQPAQPATLGGTRWAAGSMDAAVLPVLKAGNLTGESGVSQWLAATGADAVIGTPAEALLTAAYQDTAWRQFADLDGARTKTACTAGTTQKIGSCFSGDWLDNAQGFFGSSTGDPHNTSFDQLSFDYQGVGEFVLVESVAGPDLRVQARYITPTNAPNLPACGSVSLIGAVAIGQDDVRLGVYAGPTLGLMVDGTAIDGPAALAAALPADWAFELDADTLTLALPSGETIRIAHNGPSYLNFDMALPDSRRGQVRGLLGNANGVPDDDIRSRDGQRLAVPTPFDGLTDAFGDSWRITDAESLFDYPAGQGTADFTIAGYPDSPAVVDALPSDVRAAAEAACADVEQFPQREWCVLDTACSATGAGDYNGIYRDVPRPSVVMRPAAEPILTSGNIRQAEPVSLASDDMAGDALSCRTPAPTDNRVFREASGISLDGTTVADITAPGQYADAAALQPAAMPATDDVDVYLLHLPADTRIASGFASVRFGGPILGVAVASQTLADSDAFGRADLTYPVAGDPGAAARGPELADEAVTVSGDGRTLTLRFGRGAATQVVSDVDQLRVFVGPAVSTKTASANASPTPPPQQSATSGGRS